MLLAADEGDPDVGSAAFEFAMGRPQAEGTTAIAALLQASCFYMSLVFVPMELSVSLTYMLHGEHVEASVGGS